MSREVGVVDAVPHPFAAVRVSTVLARWPGEFGAALGKVYEALRASEIKHLGLNIMVYRPRPDGMVDIECGVEVAGRFEGRGEVFYCETPAGRAVTMAHMGPYGKLGESYDAMNRWSRENGCRLSGVCWELYGHWNDDWAKVRTDLFLMLAAGGGTRT